MNRNRRREMIVEIEAQGIKSDPRWREMIDEGVRKIQRFSHEVLRVRVALVASRHHLLGNHQVRLVIHLPHAQIIRHKKAAQMGDAIRGVFATAERAVKEYTRRRHKPYQTARSRPTKTKPTQTAPSSE